MSYSLYFYAVKPLSKKLPELINTDNTAMDYYAVDAECAAGWEKAIGQPVTLQFETIDLFNALESIFGRRPSSLTSYPCRRGDNDCDIEYKAHFDNEECQWVSKAQLKPYYYMKETPSIVYDREQVAQIENEYLVDTEGFRGAPLKRKDIMVIIKRYMQAHGEEDSDFSYYTQPLFELMKAYMVAGKRGVSVVCYRE